MKPTHPYIFWFSFTSFVVALIACLFSLYYAVPIFAEMFADFGAELPKLTVMAINFEHATSPFLKIILFCSVGITALAFNLTERISKKKRAFALLIPVAPLLFLVWHRNHYVSTGFPVIIFSRLTQLGAARPKSNQSIEGQPIQPTRDDLLRNSDHPDSDLSTACRCIGVSSLRSRP